MAAHKRDPDLRTGQERRPADSPSRRSQYARPISHPSALLNRHSTFTRKSRTEPPLSPGAKARRQPHPLPFHRSPNPYRPAPRRQPLSDPRFPPLEAFGRRPQPAALHQRPRQGRRPKPFTEAGVPETSYERVLSGPVGPVPNRAYNPLRGVAYCRLHVLYAPRSRSRNGWRQTRPGP